MTPEGHLAEIDELNRAECLGLIAKHSVGRLGLLVDGRPEILPINYALDGDTILFRTAPGTVLNQAGLTTVAFEVDDIDETTRTGWSVLVQGEAQDIADTVDATSERLRALKLPTWAPGDRDHWFHVVPDKITGRRIRTVAREL